MDELAGAVVAVVVAEPVVDVEVDDGGAVVDVEGAVEVRAGGAVVDAGRGRVVVVGCCTTGT